MNSSNVNSRRRFTVGTVRKGKDSLRKGNYLFWVSEVKRAFLGWGRRRLGTVIWGTCTRKLDVKNMVQLVNTLLSRESKGQVSRDEAWGRNKKLLNKIWSIYLRNTSSAFWQRFIVFVWVFFLLYFKHWKTHRLL